MKTAVELAKELLSRASVTPDDAGCQQIIAEQLEQLGFRAEHLRFGDVDNLWITHGERSPCLIFVGHTDVVPTGPLDEWTSDPFKPEIRNGYLYGRGAADMKGSLACMVNALERFVTTYPDHSGTIALLITSDEEGMAINGTCKVVEYLQSKKIKINWCLVGEPSSREKIGDAVKNGRRGSLTGNLRVNGVQGHVAYPERASNPIHNVNPALTELCKTVWDKGNKYYPPTTFQISNVHAGTGADNVIPGHIEILFNFRYSTEVTHEELKKRVDKILKKHKLDFDIEWHVSGGPFLTPGGRLLEAVKDSVKEVTNLDPELSTGGGTSDGRFISPTGAEVIELGPVNATIHKIDECVKVDDLETLSVIYEKILQKLML